jgi:hypothetical protein
MKKDNYPRLLTDSAESFAEYYAGRLTSAHEMKEFISDTESLILSEIELVFEFLKDKYLLSTLTDCSPEEAYQTMQDIQHGFSKDSSRFGGKLYNEYIKHRGSWVMEVEDFDNYFGKRYIETEEG